ncbi:MAG: glycosyltransferase [Paenibacillaceae bacterium]
MKSILISSFDMEVGGVERSLISMLDHFDYQNYEVDLMLYSHTGDFLPMLPKRPRLLKEMKSYKTFRLSIGQTIKSGRISIGMARLLAKYRATTLNKSSEQGFKQMQFMWKYSLPFLPRLQRKFDVAISYLWPHYFVGYKVNANMKIAWIHTDFSTVETNVKLDVVMWNKFDHIVAVSEECRNAFVRKYPVLKQKVIVVENITSPQFVKAMADEKVDNPMSRDNRFKLLSVARLSHAKGIDNAVKAFKILKDRGYDNLAWYVVGYGGDEAMIKDLIKECKLENDFILLGKQTNPYPYMKAADLYVQPSRYEGKAVTVVEAQILARPVIITNYPTAKSQVIDGVNGYITDLSVEGIVSGIERLYADHELRKTLSVNCERKNYGNVYELEKLYKLIS